MGNLVYTYLIISSYNLLTFFSFSNPLRNHPRQLRRRLRRQEHDWSHLRGRTSRLRIKKTGKTEAKTKTETITNKQAKTKVKVIG